MGGDGILFNLNPVRRIANLLFFFFYNKHNAKNHCANICDVHQKKEEKSDGKSTSWTPQCKQEREGGGKGEDEKIVVQEIGRQGSREVRKGEC